MAHTHRAEEALSMSRIGSLPAIILLAFVLQGCLVEYKEVIDVYDAVFGIAAGAEERVFSYRFDGEGSYCFPPSLLLFEGRIRQRLPDPSSLQVIVRHFGESGGAMAV
jgi:hypothetical protein